MHQLGAPAHGQKGTQFKAPPGAHGGGRCWSPYGLDLFGATSPTCHQDDPPISVISKSTILITLPSFLRKKYVQLVPRAGLQVAPGHVPQGATPGGCWGGTEIGLYTTCSRALAVTHFKHIWHLAVQRVSLGVGPLSKLMIRIGMYIGIPI